MDEIYEIALSLQFHFMTKRWLTPIELRQRVGKTQFEIAVAVGKQPSSISDWETGKRKPKLELFEVKLMMRAYSATLDELVAAFSRVDPDDL